MSSSRTIIFLETGRITPNYLVEEKLMIVVEIVGGLGNQMYGYALYRTLLARGRNVKMDLRFWDHQNSTVNDKRKYLLSEVFNIEERVLTRTEYFTMKAARALGLVRTYRDNEQNFQQEILNVRNGVLRGYWQSFKYCAEIEDTIRKEFTFKKPLTGRSAEVIDEISSCNSVSISFRRGDYVRLGSVLPMEYYAKAVAYVKERVPDAKFFCISDDIDYCRDTFKEDNAKFLDCSTGDNPDFDMQVIASCRHNILANSTFSLWGAWLNPNPDRIVIRPSSWKSAEVDSRKDFWPDEWVAIPS